MGMEVHMIPIKNGYGKVLGHLEQDILEALWRRGEASGREVFEEVSRDIAITTVLTVLERFVSKALVKKIRGREVNLFRSVYTKEELAKKISDEVFRSILGLSAPAASAAFVNILADIQPIELDRLATLVESKKKELQSCQKDINALLE
ncbi:MAG TPA: BlaI/MecI/CopY family transcriptional regulator [Syntrophales bacterium]|nr:BlaI/MecI/CopY family transcriptional regulator [Syntrophales bacterium]